MHELFRLYAACTLAALLTISGCGGDSTESGKSGGAQEAPETAPDDETQTLTDLSLPAIENDPRPQVAADQVLNPEAPIPPQCYTKAEGEFNPCYTCHQTYKGRQRPNYMNDGALQGSYDFSPLGETNSWKNLFIDRTEQVAAISDEHIQQWVSQDNYSGFIRRLRNNDDWNGPIPAINNLARGAEAFDEHGFARDGSGWVAFNYKPLPSTFWPTNGNTDDVMMRLPKAFRTSNCNPSNSYSRDVYMANLAIVEAAIQDKTAITTPPIDENVVCADLNGDGNLTTVTQIQRPEHFVGAASDIEVTPMLYPKGVQFLHTVRYVGTDPSGDIYIPKRMKEVRYMKKIRFYNKAQLRTLYGNELQEKRDGNIPRYTDQGDQGLDNGFGWMVLGFIEGEWGRLRKQTREEQKFCMGCHTSIGTTIDQTFAFPRKVTGAEGWGYIDVEGMKDAPTRNASEGEILNYFRRVGGGNEFRENEQMQQKWFNEDGTVKSVAVRNADVEELITPSHERALKLNKAYRVLVDEQSFRFGRDATVKPVENVHENIDPDTMTPLPAEKRLQNEDIRLDWNR